VHPLPERISFAQGAGVGIPFATAWYALNVRAHALAGEFVLVHGASGGVGTAAVQIAHAAGMRVIGTAGTDKGKKLAEDLGAYAVLDHGKADYLDEIPQLTCEHGIDVVLEMLADVNLNKDLKVLAKGGRIVVIGCRGAVEIEPREAMGKNADICGMVIFNASRQEKRTMHAALVAGLANGTLNPIKGKELPLSEAAQAHKDVMSSGAYGKIVLIP
jgi:NADPH2:quinone reductase